ncbi:VCBS repeat-containing protein, partial [candidate division KSB1 bacterium]|nr:VCBS repeat-containing protein [candidate division KSB1 bacterium]
MRYKIYVIIIILEMIIFTSTGSSQILFERETIDPDYSAFFITNFDLDKDGDQDVISGRLQLAWWENNGHANFTKHYLGNFTRLFSVFPIDIDKDGDIDLLTADIAETTIRWYKNDGNNNFQMIHLISDVNRAESVAASDFDKDGDLDICVVTTETQLVFWCEHTGNMNFETRHTLATDFDRGHKIAVADIDGNGWTDIIAVGSIGFRWWQNSGNKNFSQRTIGTGGLGFKVVDIDKNGTLDILFCRHGDDGYVLLYLNNGSGAFTSRTISTGEKWPSWVTVGDINNNGMLDFVLVNGGRRAGPLGELVYFENKGGYNFDRYLVPDSEMNVPFMAELADFDRNGSLDIVSGNESYVIDNVYYKGKLYLWDNTSQVAVETVSTPDTPTGATSGKTGDVLQYETSGSISNFGHPVEYRFDWGNGNQSSWGSSSAIHSYGSQGVFNVKACARCQEHTTIVSDWSNSLQVTISPNAYNVSGRALHYSNNNPIQNVSLTVSGDITETKITGVEGLYGIMVGNGNSIIITPAKTKGESVGYFDITTYDAA